jgi:hypothetical protein
MSGPLFSASHTDLSYSWCYWMNVVVSGVSMLLFTTCYFPPNFRELNSTKTRTQEFMELDFGGFILYATGLILLLLGFCKILRLVSSYQTANRVYLAWTEGQYSWSSPHVLATLIIGLFILVAFVLYGKP